MSRHGLGLSTDDWWDATGRELQALREVYDGSLMRWAIEQAMYANVHFRERDSQGDITGVPFVPEDFLGSGSRAQRTLQSAKEKAEVIQANARLAQMVRGAPPGDNIPAWARGKR